MAKSIATFEVRYGQVVINYFSIQKESVPETFGSEDQYVFMRDTYSISGVIAAETAQAFKGKWDAIDSQLSLPGETLKITAAGQVLVDHGNPKDLDGGPHPKKVQLTRITGGLAALVAFDVEIARPVGLPIEQRNSFQRITDVEVIEQDERGMARRIISGTFRRAPGPTKVDAATQAAIEAVYPRPRSFRRTRKWNCTRAGAQVDFEFKDAELYLAFPKPIADGDATFSMGRKLVDGKDNLWKTIKHLEAWYEAAKGVPLRTLTAWLLNLALSRMGQKSGCAVIVTELTFSEKIFAGRLSLTVTSEYTDTAQGRMAPELFAQERDRMLGKAVTGAGGDAHDLGPTGTSGLSFRGESRSGGSGVRWTSSGTNPPVNNVNSSGLVGRATSAKPTLTQALTHWLDMVKALGIEGGFELSAGGVQSLFSFNTPSNAAEMTVRKSLKTVRHLAVLKLKAKDAEDIVQETANPTTTLTEFGRARFIGEIPADFPPKSDGLVDVQEVRPGLPVQDAVGQWIVPVSWMRRAIVGKA